MTCRRRPAAEYRHFTEYRHHMGKNQKCRYCVPAVEDVELLVDAQRQELLDHLAGVRAPERRGEIIREGNY
ncbi:hypothetical protein NQZ68_014530 [Dissostichus eleginoides]|nr:hypothetical protein NQZ68_014530 [Dissostichus eleginoides]